MNAADSNQLLFLRWLATEHPALYNAHISAGAANTELSGFFDSITSAAANVGNFVTGMLDKAPELFQQYVTTKQQAELIKVNLERARTGNAPINADGSLVRPAQTTPLPVNNTGAPVPVPTGAFGGIPPWALIAGGLGLAWFLLRR